MSRDDVQRLQKGYDEIWRKGNLDRGIEALGSDIEWIVPQDIQGRPVRRGTAEVKEFFADFLDYFDTTEADYEFFDAGDRVVVVNCFRARAKGSGIETELRFAQVWTFSEGEPVRMQWYESSDEALQDCGLVER